jgi:hypothetical protein
LSVQPTAARASSARRKVDSSTGFATATDAVRRKSMDIATKGVEVTGRRPAHSSLNSSGAGVHEACRDARHTAGYELLVAGGSRV